MNGACLGRCVIGGISLVGGSQLHWSSIDKQQDNWRWSTFHCSLTTSRETKTKPSAEKFYAVSDNRSCSAPQAQLSVVFKMQCFWISCTAPHSARECGWLNAVFTASRGVERAIRREPECHPAFPSQMVIMIISIRWSSSSSWYNMVIIWHESERYHASPWSSDTSIQNKSKNFFFHV